MTWFVEQLQLILRSKLMSHVTSAVQLTDHDHQSIQGHVRYNELPAWFLNGVKWSLDLSRQRDAADKDGVRSVDLQLTTRLTPSWHQQATVARHGEGERIADIGEALDGSRGVDGHSRGIDDHFPQAVVVSVGNEEDSLKCVVGGDVPWILDLTQHDFLP